MMQSFAGAYSGRVRSNLRALQHLETTGAGIPRAGARHGSSHSQPACSAAVSVQIHIQMLRIPLVLQNIVAGQRT